MDYTWDASFICGGPQDTPYLPERDTVVNVFGKTYSSSKDRQKIAERLRSLFWMTYRKAFPPIFLRTGPTCDAGWGCMHRCGQMMLAEAMTRVHLGEDWRWTPGCQDGAYCQLRRNFQDIKCALYSIQNIVMMGMALDKPVGSWFGPNTVAQVIKKLCAYDPAISWYVHITVEDGLIVDEIRSACQKAPARPTSDMNPPALSPTESLEEEWDLAAFKARFGDDVELVEPASHIHGPITRDVDEDFLEVVLPPTYDFDSSDHSPSPLPTTTTITLTDVVEESPIPRRSPSPAAWRPLLLFIPLRLGVQQSNPCYFRAIKAVLKLPQSIGIIGGRPSHAVWIVGVVGEDDVLCLDPHVTQPASLGDELTDEDDRTHHCDTPVRMPLNRLDPSMVLGFLCQTEASFDQLCTLFEQDVLKGGFDEPALFELRQTRPFNLPPRPPASSRSTELTSSDTSSKEDLKVDLVANPDAAIRTESPWFYPEGPLGDALGVVRDVWSECHRVASDTVRSLTSLNDHKPASGSEFEVL